jgi:ribonuclease HII
MIQVGIDEVGRGCWAGPLVAGAVILNAPIAGLTDSKLLSKKQRQALDIDIRLQAQAIGLGWVEAAEVDKLGLTKAQSLAMTRALDQIEAPYDEIIIDGHINYLSGNPLARAVIKADLTIPAVSAASIIAKVARDAYMVKMAEDYPDYAFDKHVGYGTKLHLERIKDHGLCRLHRLSFKPIQSFMETA